MTTAAATGRGPRRGMFATGMEFMSWGSGPRTLLFLPGGPGSSIPKGLMLRMSRRLFDPYLDAGYTVWTVTRRRNMPPGHTIADMADDYAEVVADELGGRVDLVVGESFGGMVAQYLAAQHPAALRHLAIVVSGAEVSDWGKEVDSRLADALARGDTRAAGAAFSEYVLRSDRLSWARRLVGPLFARWMIDGGDFPPSDVLVETRAEMTFDSRSVLPRIQAPTLLLCGDRDQFFPRDVVEETAALIPDCSLIWYEGKGHMRTAASTRIAPDVLGFVSWT